MLWHSQPAIALAECALWGDDDRGLGAHLRLGVASSPAVDLFGESPSRIVVSVTPRHAPALVLLARQHGLPIEDLGEVSAPAPDGTPPRLSIELHGSGATGSAEDRGSRVADELIVGLDELRHAWDGGLARALGWEQR